MQRKDAPGFAAPATREERTWSATKRGDDMTERRQEPAENEKKTRDEAHEDKSREERDASREAVEEEERTGGPRTEGE